MKKLKDQLKEAEDKLYYYSEKVGKIHSKIWTLNRLVMNSLSKVSLDELVASVSGCNLAYKDNTHVVVHVGEKKEQLYIKVDSGVFTYSVHDFSYENELRQLCNKLNKISEEVVNSVTWEEY